LGIQKRDLHALRWSGWARQDIDGEGILLSLPLVEPDGRAELVGAGGQCGRQIEAQEDSFLLACPNGNLLAAGGGLGKAQRPLALTGSGFSGIVDDNELLFNCFAWTESVVLAGEACRLAADIGEQWLVIADQR